MKTEGKERLIRLSSLSLEQAEEVLKIKNKNKHRDIEDIAVDLGYIESESKSKQKVH